MLQNTIPSQQAQNADESADTQPSKQSSASVDEIEILKKQCEEYLNGWKRAKADYINFKNEQEKHQKELAQAASMGAVIQIIPLAENLRKAFLHLSDDLKGSGWVAGIEQIYKQFKETLKNFGVEEYTGLKEKKFDPSLHQAVGQEYIDAKDEDIITQEISAGYKLYGRVIAPAQVIVNKKPQQKTSVSGIMEQNADENSETKPNDT